MPNKTQNLSLNTWVKTEPVDFDEINDNFDKIDTFTVCVESGTTTSNYSGGSRGIANWKYVKYSDGTIELETKLEFTNLKCNGGISAPYYSGTSTLQIPFELINIYDIQMHLASNTIGWVSDITGQSVSSKVVFRVMSMTRESSNMYKQVFISIRGVYSNENVMIKDI